MLENEKINIVKAYDSIKKMKEYLVNHLSDDAILDNKITELKKRYMSEKKELEFKKRTMFILIWEQKQDIVVQDTNDVPVRYQSKYTDALVKMFVDCELKDEIIELEYLYEDRKALQDKLEIRKKYYNILLNEYKEAVRFLWDYISVNYNEYELGVVEKIIGGLSSYECIKIPKSFTKSLQV